MALALYFASFVFKVVESNRQHDFAVYHAAGSAFLDGADPYDLATLDSYSATEIKLPYLYPPVALLFFAPLAALEYETAYLLYIAIKALALAGLLALWLAGFARTPAERIALLLIAAFGYHQTIMLDLFAGNISIFEQILIWLALYSILQKRMYQFVGLILIASLFKFTALALLCLVPLLYGRRTLKPALGGLGAFASIHALSFLARPGLTKSFLNNARLPAEFGAINPSTLALFQEIGAYLNLSWISYTLYALTVICVLYGFYCIVRRQGSESSRHLLVYAALLAFALIQPRFKDYSYILLIPPAAFVITHTLRSSAAKSVGLALVCLTAFGYQPLLAAGALFGALIWTSQSSDNTIAKSA